MNIQVAAICKFNRDNDHISGVKRLIKRSTAPRAIKYTHSQPRPTMRIIRHNYVNDSMNVQRCCGRVQLNAQLRAATTYNIYKAVVTFHRFSRPMLIAWEQFAYVIYIPFRLWAASARRSSKSTICTRSDRVVFVVESASEVNSSRRHSYAQNHIRSVAFTNYHQYLAQLWSHIHTVCIIFLASEPLTLMNAEQMKLLFADLFCSVFCLYCCVVCVCGR